LFDKRIAPVPVSGCNGAWDLKRRFERCDGVRTFVVSDAFSATELDVDPSAFTGDFAWLYGYWGQRVGEFGIPCWSDIQLVDFPSHILPLLVVMDVADDDRAFVFRYWGTERTNLQGVDMTGKSVKDLAIPGLADAMLHQNQRAVAERGPILFLNSFVAQSGVTVVYEALRLPVSDGGGEVDKVIALSTFIKNDLPRRYDDTQSPTPV
jgi:hypothetical protein